MGPKCYLATKYMKYGAANNTRIVACLFMLLAFTSTALAAVSISGPRSACDGETIVLTAPSGYRSYVWSTGDVTPSITTRQSGRYSVIVTDAGGIVDSGAVDVVFHPTPRPRIGNPREYICQGQSATLSAIDGYRSYRWNTGETARQILVSTSGWYHLVVVDSNGCVGSSDSTFLTVIDNPQPVITGPAEVCNAGVRSYSVNAPPGSTISWTVGGLGTIAGPSTLPSVDVNWTGSGLVEVRVAIPRPDGGVCESTLRMMVRMSAQLRPALDFSRRNLCLGERTVIRVVGRFARYRWSDGSTADSLVVDQFGLYWAEVEDDAGCSGISDSVLVRVHPPPVITIAGATFLCNNESTTLTATAGGNDVVLWEWSTGARSSSIPVTAPGTFTVTGTTINGCRASVTHVVRAGRYPPVSDFTLTHDLGIIDLGATVDALLDTINASQTILGVRLVAMTSPDNSRGQPRLVDGGSIPGTEVWFRMTPRVEGRHRAVIRVIMRDDCTDSVDIEVTFDVVRRLVTTTLDISLLDTLVDVGADVALPGTIVIQPGATPESIDIDLLLRWNATVFRGLRITGATTLALAIVGDQQYAILRLSSIDTRSTSVRSFFIEGTAMLAAVTTTPVAIDSFNVIGQEQYDVSTKDGSVSTRSCWIPGRLIRFGVSFPFTIAVQQRGGILEVTGTSMPNEDIEVRLYSSDGREVLTRRCTMRMNADGQGACTIDVSGLPAGIYLVRAQSESGQRTLPALVAP